jgi:hypothetical protein
VSRWITQIDLIAAYGSLGRNDEARSAITELHRLMPGYTVQDWAKRGPTISEVPAYAVEYERMHCVNAASPKIDLQSLHKVAEERASLSVD